MTNQFFVFEVDATGGTLIFFLAVPFSAGSVVSDMDRLCDSSGSVLISSSSFHVKPNGPPEVEAMPFSCKGAAE